ncbi:MAG: hypothetical protein JNK45_30750 [Myxococcales bacterium]|nr:hypothetical protein [Myxococcales bacterium]
MRSVVRLAASVLTGLGAIACGSDPSPPAGASGTSTADTTVAATGESSSGASETSGSSDTSTTGGSSEGDTSLGGASESSTGGSTLCGLTDDPEQAGPWFRLYNDSTLVEDGATLELECGGQGAWMFYLATEQGGFTPPGSAAYFAVTLDVPGFDELSPDGHFFDAPNYGINLGCAGGSDLAGIAVLLPDALTDPTVLDGVAATIHAALLVPDGAPVILDAAITLAVDPALGAQGCGHG